jgi:hypothetical protein
MGERSAAVRMKRRCRLNVGAEADWSVTVGNHFVAHSTFLKVGAERKKGYLINRRWEELANARRRGGKAFT